MSVEWKRCRALSNPNAVNDFMKKYNCILSKELVDCIITNNGGRPYPDVVSLGNGDESDVKALLSFNETDKENAYKIIEYFISKYHGSLVPFASDSAGNYYCEKGRKIVLWTQDGEVIPVANSFTDFIDSLHEV